MMDYIKRAAPPDALQVDHVHREVAEIIRHVRQKGEQALIEYNTMFDGNTRTELRISHQELNRAYELSTPQLIEDLRFALSKISAVAQHQKETLQGFSGFSPTPGVSIDQRIIPIRSCCCYVSGGGYPLYSSALMLAATAKAAGVERIAMCAPTIKGTNDINPAILLAMDMAGATEIYAVGGAHAIAAFAYGTGRIEPVDLIVGAGNQYVTEAKRQCYGQVGIDFLAGPSEILILADDTANRDFLAADLLSESEHDPMGSARLITTSRRLAEETEKKIQQVLTDSDSDDLRSLWDRNGEIIVADSLTEACDATNSYAPEHLVLRLAPEAEETAISKVYNFGSLLIGEYTPVVFSDYVSGVNHILPTKRVARYSGGVWVGTFCKVCTVQRITRSGSDQIAARAVRLAEGEGLASHAMSASLRLM